MVSFFCAETIHVFSVGLMTEKQTDFEKSACKANVNTKVYGICPLGINYIFFSRNIDSWFKIRLVFYKLYLNQCSLFQSNGVQV